MANSNNIDKFGAPIVYFENEGRQNLDEVIKIVKRILKKREELRPLKIVFFTAFGEGPALAYNKFAEFAPAIIAVTFPRTFAIKRDEEWVHPKISENISRFFAGVGIEILVPQSLPFDTIEGMEAHNQQVNLVKNTLSIFGGGFSLCIQAVLRACDAGLIQTGDLVIGISGDTAGTFRASTTQCFLAKSNGIVVEEIFCKPRKLTITRSKPELKKLIEGEVSNPQLQR